MRSLKIPVFISTGIMIILLILAYSPAFAYETDDLPFNYIYRPYGDANIYHSSYGGDINGTHADFWGIETGFPVPTYADNGDYSLYFSLKFSTDIPDANFSLIVSPYSDTAVYPYTAMTNTIKSNIFTELVQYNCNMKAYYGTFQWNGKSNCTYQLLACRELESAYSDQVEYTVWCVLDMKLAKEDEYEPMRLGITMGTTDYSSSTMFNCSAILKFMDTSNVTAMIYWFEQTIDKLDELKSAFPDNTLILTYLNTIDGNLNNIRSSLNMLTGVDFDYRLTRIYRELSNIYDDDPHNTDPDEDVTEWANQASQFESDASNLHEIEQSYLAALNDFTFPAVPDGTQMGSIINPFFGIPLITSMVVTALSLMVVFTLLSKK